MISPSAISGSCGGGKLCRAGKRRNPIRGHRASSANPIDWAEFTKVADIWHRRPNQYAGLGFVFSIDDPFVGIDPDDCLDANGIAKPWGRGIVERFYDTDMEISPSGLGLKIWAKGDLPDNVAGVKVGDGKIEMYNRSRYFTLTGCLFRATPGSPSPRAPHNLANVHRLRVPGCDAE